MQMTYTRRPVLEGRNLRRAIAGVIRGNKRRMNPDGTSVVPYLPSVSGKTLNLLVQATPINLTFSSNSFDTILAELRAAVGGAAVVFDADGCVGIQSTTTGADSVVKVIGGTAAPFLGFDLEAHPVIMGKGGDIESAPEGRIGNPFGAVFPGKDNLTVDVINRGLARIAGNSDVLHASLARLDATMEKTTFAISADRKVLTPAAGRYFTGAGVLSGSPTAEELAAFYLLVDTATGLPAPSRVVAVTRGTPVGNPPYANTASYSALDGGNVLGLNLAKVTATPITGIVEGRVAKVGVDLVAAGVAVGDLAEITGASNNVPFNHNGARWVVEEVPSSGAVALRPLSQGELAALGLSFDEVQPVLQLNEEASGSFGNLTIRTGQYMSDVKLVVSPPLPKNGTYELWASVPKSGLELGASSLRHSLAPMLRTAAERSQVLPDGILSGLTPSTNGANLTFASGIVRWKGKAFSIPGQSIAQADISAGTVYAYLDLLDLQVKTGTLTVWATNALPLCQVTHTGSVLSGLISLVRPLHDENTTLTVGVGGQFLTLAKAVDFLNALALQAVAQGQDYPHYRILVLGLCDMGAAATLLGDVHIEGVGPQAVVQAAGTQSLTFEAGTFLLRNLTFRGVNGANVVAEPALVVGDSVEMQLDGVKVEDYRYALGTVDTGTFSRLVANDCTFRVSRGVLSSPASWVRMSRCTFSPSAYADASGAALSMLGATSADILLDNCRFLGWTNTNTAQAFLATVTGSLLARFCHFDVTNTGTDSLLLDVTGAGSATVVGCTSGVGLHRFVRHASTGQVRLLRNNITVKSQQASDPATVDGFTVAVLADVAEDNRINALAPDGGQVGGIVLAVRRSALINYITGAPRVALTVDSSAPACTISLLNNRISSTLTSGVAGILVVGQGNLVQGNQVDVVSGHCIRSGYSGSTAAEAVIRGNSLFMNDNAAGLQLNYVAGVRHLVEGNRVTSGTQASGQTAMYINASALLRGNVIQVTQSRKGIYCPGQASGAVNVTLQGNYVEAASALLVERSPSDVIITASDNTWAGTASVTSLTARFSGDEFQGATTLSGFIVAGVSRNGAFRTTDCLFQSTLTVPGAMQLRSAGCRMVGAVQANGFDNVAYDLELSFTDCEFLSSLQCGNTFRVSGVRLSNSRVVGAYYSFSNEYQAATSFFGGDFEATMGTTGATYNQDTRNSTTTGCVFALLTGTTITFGLNATHEITGNVFKLDRVASLVMNLYGAYNFSNNKVQGLTSTGVFLNGHNGSFQGNDLYEVSVVGVTDHEGFRFQNNKCRKTSLTGGSFLALPAVVGNAADPFTQANSLIVTGNEMSYTVSAVPPETVAIVQLGFNAVCTRPIQFSNNVVKVIYTGPTAPLGLPSKQIMTVRIRGGVGVMVAHNIIDTSPGFGSDAEGGGLHFNELRIDETATRLLVSGNVMSHGGVIGANHSPVAGICTGGTQYYATLANTSFYSFDVG